MKNTYLPKAEPCYACSQPTRLCIYNLPLCSDHEQQLLNAWSWLVRTRLTGIGWVKKRQLWLHLIEVMRWGVQNMHTVSNNAPKFDTSMPTPPRSFDLDARIVVHRVQIVKQDELTATLDVLVETPLLAYLMQGIARLEQRRSIGLVSWMPCEQLYQFVLTFDMSKRAMRNAHGNVQLEQMIEKVLNTLTKKS